MIIIRHALKSDIEQMADLFDLYRIFYRQESDRNAARNFLLARLDNKESEIIVAEESGKLLGFTQLYPQFSSTQMKKFWVLNDLFVLEVYRRMGLAKALIKAAAQFAKDNKAPGLLLETEKTNVIGNALYPACGFKEYNDSNFYWLELS
jgi:ribosomal protein S18 acetylase RimI-like enzyme